MKMRVLTYNVHHWEGTDKRIDVARVIEVIRATEADIVALNEVYHPARLPGMARAALDEMAEALGMEAAFGQATSHPWPEGTTPIGYGNACLSRWPILAFATHRLASPPDREPRVLLEVRVQAPDARPLTVYITHLDHRSEAVRMAQVQTLLLWTSRDREQPHLLVGDFNALAPSDFPDPAQWQALINEATAEGFTIEEPRVLPRLLRAGYVDCAAQAGGDLRPTHPTTRPRVRIDYIFASKALAPALRRYQRWDAPPAQEASDHFPVLAEFAWPPA